MKKQDIIDAAKECAQYIMDSDGEQENYSEYIEDGNDPRTHILYQAGVVLGVEKEFEEDIQSFLKGTK